MSAFTSVDTATLAAYCRAESEDSALLLTLGAAAESYILSYTGQSVGYIAAHPEFVPVYMTLVADMYDTRQLTVQSDKLNPFVRTVLDMHSCNLL